MSDSQIQDEELLELLNKTSKMTADATLKQYDEFIKNSESRIDTLIYRLMNRYNLGKSIENINIQSQRKK